MKIVRVSAENTTLLKDFVNNIGSAGESFRYFNTRSVSIWQQHVVTLLLVDTGIAMAYGHLEKEGGYTWLGICVLPIYKGKGYGRIMMKALIQHAVDLEVDEITLTVDKTNTVAISLYESFNFILSAEHSTYYQFRYSVNSARH